MHNCKETRKLLIELALDQVPSDQSQALLAQLEHCPGCREEFAFLRNVLRVAEQAMQSTVPEEGFWSGYHERLQQSLTRDSAATTTSFASRSPSETGALVRLRKLFTTSLRVPVPVAALLIILFGLSIGFAARSRSQSIAGPSSVLTRTVEVPVIQERTVTRVVYRDRKPGTSHGRTAQPERPGSNSVAVRKNGATEGTPISLVGFKPANEVKLTIIRGSYRHEK